VASIAVERSARCSLGSLPCLWFKEGHDEVERDQNLLAQFGLDPSPRDTTKESL
jgi:hypothetical protein